MAGDAIVGDLREATARRAARGGTFPRGFWVVAALRLGAWYALAGIRVRAAIAFREILRAARSLGRRAGSSASAVVVIALGIALSTMMASVTYGLFFRGLDVPAPEELRIVAFHDPTLPGDDRAPPDLFRAWRDAPSGFRSLAGFRTGAINLATHEGTAELRSAGWVTADAFDLLGVEPVRGRPFTGTDVGGGPARVVLLSHDLWRSRFGGGDVIGTDVRVDGRPMTVVGVMPPGFAFPINQEIWLPILPGSDTEGDPGGLIAFGRLGKGVRGEVARAGLERLVGAVFPERAIDVGRSIRVEVVRFNEYRGGSVLRPLLGSMMAAALLVLLVASANVAGLLLARTASRLKEVGVRTALGGGRVAISVPFLAEAAILAVVGAAVGLVIAAVGVGVLEETMSAAGKPYWMHVRLDAPTLAFAAVTTLLVALLAGAGPVLLALRSDPADLLRTAGRGAASASPGRAGRALVAFQIALSCGLLIGSGLVVRSLVELTKMDFPFARAEVLTAAVRPPSGTYPDGAARARLHDVLLARLGELPGVERAALSHGLPSLAFERFAVRAEGSEAVDVSTDSRAWRAAGSPDILGILAMEPARGRGFAEADDGESEAVAVVEAEMAERLFGGADALGRRFQEIEGGRPGPWRRVVGITGDLRLEGVSDLDRGIGYYMPLAQADAPRFTILVEGSPPTSELAALVRELVASVDPDLAVSDVRTLREVVGQTSFFYQIFGGLFALFGVAGLFMACVGLYGVLSWSVSRRIPEMGMRMALGASSGSLVRLVLRDAALQTGIGLGVGLVLAAFAGDALTVLLFRVEPRDPVVFAAVVVLVALVSLGAAAVPAVRTTRLDPLAALRGD
jgi:predicted permease